MKKVLLVIAFTFSLFANDIIVKKSSCSVDATVNNIKKILSKKGLTLFGTINHGKNAKKVGMNLSKSVLIIYGNPIGGTKLMQQDMKAGLDLPLRILVYEDKSGMVKMAYRDASWLKIQHSINVPKFINKVNNGMNKITTKAGSCK